MSNTEIAEKENPSTYWPEDDWRTAIPEEVGMESEPLARMFTALADQQRNISSILIVRHGFMLVEAYYSPFQRDIKHGLASAAKSITSLLLGLAIEGGYLAGTNQCVLDFFPKQRPNHMDQRKRKITLEHLLTMTDGLRWHESNLAIENRRHSITQMTRQTDWVKFVLDRPMIREPGARFNYNSGASHLLSAVINQATGLTAVDFAADKLFKPLGIDDYLWDADPQGITIGGWGLQLRPFDVAKIGYLLLNRGRWQEKQLISSTWITASSATYVDSVAKPSWRHRMRRIITNLLGRQVPSPAKLGYGLHWWLPPFGGYSARGYAGQALFIIPKHGLVVVYNAGLQRTDPFLPERLMAQYIIPSIKSFGPLAHSPESSQGFERFLPTAEENESQRVWPLPEMAQLVSGHTYRLQKNPTGMKFIGLDFEATDVACLTITESNISYKGYVGLDNRYRITEIDEGNAVAMRGKWTDDHTFVIESCPLKTGDRFHMRFSFQRDEVVITSRGIIVGKMLKLRGVVI